MYSQFILDNPDKPWDWFVLSRNPSISWKFVQDNPDKPWNWAGLSGNHMGWPYKEKIMKVKEIFYWTILRNDFGKLRGRRRINRINRYWFAHHLV